MARFLSLIGHPLLVLTWVLLLMLATYPYGFGVGHLDEQRARVLVLTVFITTFLLPGMGVAIMRPLGLIQSLEMHDKQERTGPYILTGVFYLWVFKSLLSDVQMPPLFVGFALGTTIGLFLAFFANIFTKISAHAVGMGGLATMVLLMCLRWPVMGLDLPLPGHRLLLSGPALLAVALLFAGAVGMSRLRLRAHEPADLYRGYAAGVAAVLLGQILA
ncbi:MAG TPA: hypothetical protein PK971_15690 [Saprospiraceae bacterium]|nr:hypothetical protein [Saprospiraceae bacterium]